MEWQDISTAPKDGRKVLLVDGYGIIEVCLYSDSEWLTAWDEDLFHACEEDSDGGPTHWMPLPTPPT